MRNLDKFNNIMDTNAQLTPSRIIEWAREAGGDDWGLFREFMPEIETLARLAYEAGRADENEACAKLCEESDRYRGEYFAKLIRSRREQ